MIDKMAQKLLALVVYKFAGSDSSYLAVFNHFWMLIIWKKGARVAETCFFFLHPYFQSGAEAADLMDNFGSIRIFSSPLHFKHGLELQGIAKQKCAKEIQMFQNSQQLCSTHAWQVDSPGQSYLAYKILCFPLEVCSHSV